MLSTLHYYNSYRPFILNKIKDRENKTSPYKSAKSIRQYKNTDFTYFLNKALNDNVKSYIFELSINFNSLKNISNNIYEKMHYNLPVDTLKDNIDNFVLAYNRFVGFLQENIENSKHFENILNKTKNDINNNLKILDNLGINISSNGFLNIREGLNLQENQIDKEETKSFYNNIYEKICSFMVEPMSNYMDFKDFSYYFNYSGDYNKNKSFKIIEQGLLLDISL